MDHNEGWAPKNWCFWNVMLEKTLESPLGCKEIKAVNPTGSQSWIYIGGTDAEAKAPVLWPPYVKSQLTGKDPDAGKDWRQEETGMTEDEIVGWHQQFNGHEFEQALGDGEEQRSLTCFSSWGCKELDTTEWLNNNNNNKSQLFQCRLMIKRIYSRAKMPRLNPDSSISFLKHGLQCADDCFSWA